MENVSKANNSSVSRKRLRDRPAFLSLTSSFICILIGLLIGLLILICINANNAFPAFGAMIVHGFSNSTNISMFIYNAAPIILTGLAVAFTFKAGLFNIGGSGQYIIGGGLAVICALYFKLPWYLSLLVAMLGGAVWGSLPGIFKAFFNVNEVISAIMLNWVGLYMMELITSNVPGITDSTYGNHTIGSIKSVNANGILPSWGLENFDSYLTIGIFIAIIVAVIAWFVLKKTVFGFQIKACGMNKFASRYAGISDKRTIILSFMISGMFAALGGAIYYLSPSTNGGFSFESTTLPSAGFDGISVALLAANNPLGCVLSALFISYLSVSGEALQNYRYAPELFSVITGVIVYSASFVLLIKQWLSSTRSGKAFAKIVQKKMKQRKLKSEKAVEEEAPNQEGLIQEELSIQNLAKSNPIPSEEIKSHPFKKVAEETNKLVEKEKEKKNQEKESQTFVISKTPYTRDLNDYNPEAVQNLDHAELTRKEDDDKKDESSSKEEK